MRRVHRFTMVLAALGALGAVSFAAAPALAGTSYGLLFSFASPEGFNGPVGLAIDDSSDSSKGDVYVAEYDGHDVKKFVLTGETATQEWAREVPGASLYQATVDDYPGGDEGDVYVASLNGTVYRFSAAGVELPIAIEGLAGPSGVAVDAVGDFFVSLFNGTVMEFNDKWEPVNAAGTVVGASENTVVTGLNRPQAVAVSATGERLYVATGSGTEQYKLSGGAYQEEPVLDSSEARGVAIAPSGDVFVNRATEVAEYESFGTLLRTFGSGILSGNTFGVGVFGKRVYVADQNDNHVDVFEEGPTPEAPKTEAPEKITATTATLKGELKPPTTRLKYYFEYNVGPSCAGGLKTPVKEGEGTVEEEVTGLEPSAEYTVCFVADNTYGESEPGSPETFNTSAAPPEVIGESASIVGEAAGQVTFAGVINPENSKQETTYYFEYSANANGETLEAPIKTAAGEGAIPAEEFGERTVTSVETTVPVTATVYYRIVATNASGATMGKVESYTKLPIVDSEASSGLTLTGATLEVKLNPDWKTTKYHFELASSEATLEGGGGTQVPGGETGADEATEQTASVVVGGLEADRTYYWRLVAESETTKNINNINKGKPVVGSIEHFTTESLPFVSTGEAQSASRTSETFSGTVTPIDQATTYFFQYISEAGYQAALKGDAEEKADPFIASEATAALSLVVSATPQTVGPVPASGLLPEETYHYRLVAQNKFGAEYGEGHTFSTGSKALPGVSTGGASGVSQDSATLSGTVSTNGLQTNYGFEIGTEPGNYGPATGLGSIGGAATEEVHVTLGDLQPGTAYYYRIEATNADGTVQGQPESFTTPGFPTLISPRASPPLIATPDIAFPKEEKVTTGTTTKTLTNKEKLAKALKACMRDKSKGKRSRCEKQAKRKYGGAKRKNK